jgi:hypothetical protein
MTCSLDCPTATTNPCSAELSPALIRFVTDGLVATLDSYRTGRLPLHRFAWGLSARTDTLAELHPGSRAVTRLRWLQHSIDNRHTELAAGRLVQLATDEENSLTVTLASLRACSTATTRTARTPSAATATATAATVGRWPHRPRGHDHRERTVTAIH